MNAREFQYISDKFLEKNNIDMLEAVNKYSLTMGFFFNSYEDLIDFALINESDFRTLIASIERQLNPTKRILMTDKRIAYAIAISLYNTHLSVKRRKIEESYMSSIFFSEDDMREILYKYGTLMSNPLAFIVDENATYRSMVAGSSLNQLPIYINNGKGKAPRTSGYIAHKQLLDQQGIEFIDDISYHPIVWHLLQTNKLRDYEYLFNNAKSLCQRWLSNYIPNHQKMSED